MPAPRRKKKKLLKAIAPLHPPVAAAPPEAILVPHPAANMIAASKGIPEVPPQPAFAPPPEAPVVPVFTHGLVCEFMEDDNLWYVMQVHPDGSRTQYLGPFGSQDSCNKHLPV
ncbi:hypothetical protein [Chitinophaga sp. MM2321]|uniref:hypothetical protein n=1 Tax=Chitinophaga sp. MM2321 TaxID=3137178 RepID=UPI0032D570C2